MRKQEATSGETFERTRIKAYTIEPVGRPKHSKLGSGETGGMLHVLIRVRIEG